jgi:hypothetical protein
LYCERGQAGTRPTVREGSVLNCQTESSLTVGLVPRLHVPGDGNQLSSPRGLTLVREFLELVFVEVKDGPIAHRFGAQFFVKCD